MTTIRVVQYGLGPIGLGIAELALSRRYAVTAAVDIDPAKVGKPLAAFLPAAPVEVIVEPPSVSLAGRADVVLHSTQSRLVDVIDQLTALIRIGLPVISTCEELAFPWYHHPAQASALDALAQAHAVAIVGLGVNPGFVMDVLPAVLAAPCTEIARLRVERVVDVGARRRSLQRKAGVGLSPEEFARGVAEGRIGHVGLPQSTAMLADALGWVCEDIHESIEPVIGPDHAVRGLHQVCYGLRGGQIAITLDLLMHVDAQRPRDTVTIDGTPPVHLEIPGGLQGDYATIAIVVKAIPKILAAPAGLRVATELPSTLPRPRSGRAS